MPLSTCLTLTLKEPLESMETSAPSCLTDIQDRFVWSQQRNEPPLPGRSFCLQHLLRLCGVSASGYLQGQKSPIPKPFLTSHLFSSLLKSTANSSKPPVKFCRSGWRHSCWLLQSLDFTDISLCFSFSLFFKQHMGVFWPVLRNSVLRIDGFV